MGVRARAAVASLLLALLFAAPAAAAPAAPRLDGALAGTRVAADARAAVVVDLRTGGAVFARNADRPLIPASNEKLPVSVAALERLGPGFRFRTTVLGSGRQEGAVWRGNLVLRGGGDPTLTSARLADLARQVRARGITRVEGRVIADETRFDSARTAPGWQAWFSKRYCPPLSALVVDRGIIQGRASNHPAVSAGVNFRRQLAARDVVVTRPNGLGRARPGAKPLAVVQSGPLTAIVERINRDSDNFLAEMLLKELAAQTGVQGTTAGGAFVVRQVLRELGVPLQGVRIVDGSGLSRQNRLTANAVGSLLVTVRREPRLRAPFLRSLAVAGRSGTLSRRMRGTPAQGSVLAKTGTTRQASTLSGYVGDRYAFAILMNGEPVQQAAARAGQDRFVTLLAAG